MLWSLNIISMNAFVMLNDINQITFSLNGSFCDYPSTYWFQFFGLLESKGKAWQYHVIQVPYDWLRGDLKCFTNVSCIYNGKCYFLMYFFSLCSSAVSPSLSSRDLTFNNSPCASWRAKLRRPRSRRGSEKMILWRTEIDYSLLFFPPWLSLLLSL